MTRPLTLCDLDFTDLRSDDDKDDLLPRGLGGSIPPPPPPIGIPPPMMKPMLTNLEPMPNHRYPNGQKSSSNTIKKNKKTVRSIKIWDFGPTKKTYFISLFSLQVKLFWKEVREDLIPTTVGKTIWDELPPSTIDTQKLEHLFESRAKDMMTKVTFIAQYLSVLFLFYFI